MALDNSTFSVSETEVVSIEVEGGHCGGCVGCSGCKHIVAE